MTSLRRMMLASLMSAALTAAACTATQTPSSCDEPHYGGGGTDEAWRTMVDAEDDAATGGDAATITTPVDGATFSSSDAAPTFAWSSTLAKALAPAAPIRVVARTQRRSSPLDALTALVFPAAHAHKPPITGDVYYAKVEVQGADCPIAALTTDLEWAIDDDSWAALQEAKGKSMTFTVISAYLTDNRVTEGPFASASIPFEVE